VELGEDELRVAGLTLRGVALGGIATCLMVPEIGVMFDVGARVGGQLKYDTILVSHGHQDHLGDLPYLASQRHLARLGSATVHVPEEVVTPLKRIFDAWAEIENFALEVELVGHPPGDQVTLRKGLVASCVRSVHRVPSLAWLVERRVQRLRPEFVHHEGPELARLRAEGAEITAEHRTELLCVSGDTQIELFLREPVVRRCKVLVLEVTAWDDRRSVEETRQWGHIHVDELIEHVEAFTGEALVLVHRSPRHSRQQAEQVVRDRFPASVRDRVHVFGR
jgi:ribonuclease Z